MTTIGFIGLGIMGRPMALNLLKSNYALCVYARRSEAAEPLVAQGATLSESPRALAERCEVIFTVVSDTPDVEDVVLGATGIVQGAQPGSVVVDMSTISPTATRHMARQLKDRGIEMLDAPVSGGEQGAIAGTLSIMIGGRAETFERIRPLFELMGKNIVHVGDHGAGQVAKACNQILVAQTIAAVAESLSLAEALDVDPARVREALLGGFAYSRILDIHGQRMLEGNFTPGFKARLHQKDMRIALEEARRAGYALNGAAHAAALIDALIEQGGAELDSAAVFRVLEEPSG